MDADDDHQLSLQGSIILADPSLLDPNFTRTVLLLTDHQHDAGAHGYVLNRPLGKTVGDVLGGEEFSPLRHVPIFIGGPVGQEHLIFAALSWKPSAKALTCTTHLSLPDAIALQESGKHVRAFLGYSGWSSGQLEKELRGNSWITRRPEPSVLESKADESLWSTLLTTMGPYYKLLAGTPPNPELN